VYRRFTRKKIIPDIALDLNMSHRVVECILELWKATGEVIPQEPGRKGQRQKIMTPEEMEVSNRVESCRMVLINFFLHLVSCSAYSAVS